MDRSNGTPHFKSALFFKSLIALLVVLASHAASAAITYKQSNWNAPDTPKTSVTVTYTAAQTVGDLNVVIVGWNDSTASVASVTDTKGNSYVRAVGPTLSSGFATLSIYYAKNIAAASANGNTVTVTLNTSVNYPDIRIAEYAGLDLNAPLDVSVGASGNSKALNSGSVTTTTANDLLVGGNILEHSTSAAGSGYTRRIQTNDQNILEDKIVTATGSYNATATQDSTGKWVMQMAAFKAAGSGVDTQAPSTPTNLTATPTSSTQINLNWTASTDNVGVTGYTLQRCQGTTCVTFSPTGTSYNDTGLTASTTFSYQVKAKDAAGNTSNFTTPPVNATTPAAPDTQPPSTPTSLTATPASSTQINVSWTASTDNVGVTGYTLQRCQGATCVTFSPTGTSYGDTGLTASTTYSYQVKAKDAAGNTSNFTTPAVNATTPAAPDTQPPSTPTTLTATPTSSTQINVSWTASTDNVGVTGYTLQRCQGATCTTFSSTGTSLSDTGLTPSTTYSYQVKASDAAGNTSSFTTPPLNATTQSPAPVTYTYSYDSLGRLTQAIGTDGSEVDYQYDANGNVTTINRQ